MIGQLFNKSDFFVGQSWGKTGSAQRNRLADNVTAWKVLFQIGFFNNVLLKQETDCNWYRIVQGQMCPPSIHHDRILLLLRAL